MANKLILIPEPMYRNIISNISKKTEPLVKDEDNINLNFVKKYLDKTKKERTKNLSKKNVNYNQQLPRFLRLRKIANEKPVKVKLSNGMFS